MSENTIKLLSFIFTIAATVITFISTCAKGKKKTRLIKTARILQKLPNIITTIEQSCTAPGQGTFKKLLALNQCQIECQKENINYNENEWSVEIEKILETPQKKL